MKKVTFIILFLLASSHVFAASDQIPQDRKITRISVYENDIVVTFTPSFTNTQGCPETASNKIVIDMENGLGKTLYAAALSAAATGSIVGFGINGCKGHPIVYRININY